MIGRTTAAAALLGAAAAAAACGAGEAAATRGSTRRVARESLRVTVAETGILRAKNSVNVKARIPGTARIVWLVPEGTEVKAGEKLAELDKTEVQKNIDALEGQITQFDSERKTARTEYDIQVADGGAAVEKALLTLDIRESEMRRWIENEGPQTLEKKALAVEKAESEYKRRKEQYDRMVNLKAQDFVTATDVETERIATRAAELDLQQARGDRETYEKFTADIERRQKESALAEARRALDNEKLRAANLLERKKVHWEQAERRYETTVQKLKEAQEQFRAMTVMAPSPGIVIYNDRDQSDELKVGSTVYNEQAFLQLPDLSEMEAVLGIHEADVTKLKVGQKAWVTLDAFKGQRLGCEVLRISPVASERDWRSDIRKFEVILALEKNDLPLKPGATVKAEVLVGEVKDVLAVPLQAVYVKEGKYFCFVDAGGRPGRREVKLGESNASSVAVVDGLKEGDEVLLYNPEGGADGAPAGEKEKRKDGPAAPAAAPAANGGGSGAGGGAGRGGKP